MSAAIRQRRVGWAELLSFVFVFAFICMFFCQGEAQAQGRRLHRVYVQAPFALYPDPSRPRSAREVIFEEEAVRGAVERHFEAQPERFVVLPTESIYARGEASGGLDAPLRGSPQAMRFILELERAKGLFEDARRAFNRYDLPQAEAWLIEVIDVYERLLFPILNPTDLGRVYETLGLVIWETPERRGETIEAFKNMARLDPERVLATPYFPGPIVEAYQSAREELLRGRLAGPDPTDAEVVRALGELVEADLVVWGYVVQGADGGRELSLHLHRRDRRLSLPPERIPLTGVESIDAERADRAISRLSACVEPFPEEVEPPTPQRAFYLDSGFAYHVYLKRPTEEVFDNLGFALSGSYEVLDGFALRAGVNLLTSGSDVEGDLLSEFSTIRTFLGGAFSFPLRWGRPFVGFGLETTRVGEFQHTDSFYCKVNADDPAVCRPDQIESNAPGWLMGVNIQAGVSALRFKSLSLYVSGNGSFYVVPFSGKEVDLPLGFDVGVEYTF